MQKTRKQDLGDVVVLDVDANTISTEYKDIETLPDDVVSIMTIFSYNFIIYWVYKLSVYS
jgi:hypothetical protein